jgi:hypothetical protein
MINIGLFGWKPIESLPTTIGQLQHLTMLWLRNYENLKQFP